MQGKKRPNIILIIMDSARKDMFGCHGSGLGLTPNIDALAERGLVLNDHYAAGCGSGPSHVSIFTGYHPPHHKMLHNLCDMREDLPFLPLLLGRLGYKSFGHCKASFIPPAGYEDLFGFEDMRYPGKAGAATHKSLRGRAAGFLRAFPRLYNLLKQAYGAFAGREGELRISAALHDGRDSLDYLLHRMEERREGAPVFGYTTILHPHTPYYPPKPFMDAIFKGERPHPVSFKIQRDFHGYLNGNYGPAEEAIESIRKCYQADLLYGDHLIGEFARGLEERGLLEESILIITSDHGELLGEHGSINHGGGVWEELFASPCIIHCPERIEAGARVSRLTGAIDLVPTIFDLLGESEWLAGQTPQDGASAIETEGERSASNGAEARCLIVDSPPVVLPERLSAYPNLFSGFKTIHRAARTSAYKYIWTSDEAPQLYRVGEAESPENNRIDQEPEVAAGLHRRMVSYYEGYDPDFEIGRYPIPLSKKIGAKITDPLIRRELKRLGTAKSDMLYAATIGASGEGAPRPAADERAEGKDGE